MNYIECDIATHCSFRGNELLHCLEWVEKLNENLESGERFPLAGKVPFWINNSFKVASSGYWQIGQDHIYLAGRPTANACRVPTPRIRALILIAILEYVARHTDCVDAATMERIHKLESRLLTYLPVNEIPSLGQGLYAVCNSGCDPAIVRGIVVNKAGEIIAVRDARGTWTTLAGDVVDEPRGGVIVNWEA